MSAHEEVVSQTRRRLFKALSAAPVVATLSPGSAVAGDSAYTLDYEKMAEVVRGVYHFLMEQQISD